MQKLIMASFIVLVICYLTSAALLLRHPEYRNGITLGIDKLTKTGGALILLSSVTAILCTAFYRFDSLWMVLTVSLPVVFSYVFFVILRKIENPSIKRSYKIGAFINLLGWLQLTTLLAYRGLS